LGISCNDTIESIYADPGPLPAGNGTIIRCAKDGEISAADLYAKAKANTSADSTPATNLGYAGRAFTSGVKMYRILFTTERGDANRTHGYESAKVFIPDTPRAAKVPVVIGARGSRGQAGACAASKETPGLDSINHDFEAMAYPVVGLGLPIIIPDLGGYANFGAPNNPPSGYIAYDDVGKGTLDGGRALKNMVASGLSEQTAIIGHSQGGHNALSALGLAESYAPELNVAAVANFAPAWINSRLWGALFQVQTQYSINVAAYLTGADVWYHYTHGELLDGPGHGLDIFAADKRDAIKAWVETQCWGDEGLGQLLPIALYGTPAMPQQATGDAGAEPTGTVSMLYDPSFVKSVKTAAAFGQGCAPGDALCEKWIARYIADRPHLTGKAVTTPMLFVHGLADTTIPSERMKCSLDRLKEDGTNLGVCILPDRGHEGIVRQKIDYIVDWIAAKTLGEAEPAGCALNESAVVDAKGIAIPCATPPPND
jgi:pimeloyl-ACP methyl ester carboxylesterase